MGNGSNTAEQKTNHTGFPKPGELIEMTGTHTLAASDRAILNFLYQHAHVIAAGCLANGSSSCRDRFGLQSGIRDCRTEELDFFTIADVLTCTSAEKLEEPGLEGQSYLRFATNKTKIRCPMNCSKFHTRPYL